MSIIQEEDMTTSLVIEILESQKWNITRVIIVEELIQNVKNAQHMDKNIASVTSGIISKKVCKVKLHMPKQH